MLEYGSLAMQGFLVKVLKYITLNKIITTISDNDNDDHGKCGDALMKTACRNSRGLNGASVCDATASYCSAKEVSA